MERQATLSLACVLVLVADARAWAGPNSDWAAVRRLKIGTEVVLRTASEPAIPGFLAGADEAQVTILDVRRSRLPEGAVQIVLDAYVRKGTESMILDGTPVDVATFARTFPRQAIVSIEHPRARKTGPAVFGAVAGAFVGLMGGFAFGAQFPRSGDGDDPGLQNALLGAAVGLPGGAVAGYKIATIGKGIVYQAPTPSDPGRRQGFRFNR